MKATRLVMLVLLLVTAVAPSVPAFQADTCAEAPVAASSLQPDSCTEVLGEDAPPGVGRALLQRGEMRVSVRTSQPSQPLAGTALPPATSQVVVPVPLYYHSRPSCIGTNGSNPLIGDPFERRCSPEEMAAGLDREGEGDADEHAAGGAEHEHAKGHTVLLLLFIMLFIGIATAHMLERYLPFIPYTAALFVIGFFLSLHQNFKREHNAVIWPSFDTAIGIWEKADPHLTLFIFLPPLIFGEAMSLNVSQVKSCFNQCILLAGPGVLIGTALTAVVGKFLLPYGWEWNTSMLFGSILSATDPVAVVAIFNSLGVSPRLTMVISGESLFNDGTAYVVFQLMMGLCQDAEPTAGQVVAFIIRMTTWGPLIGAVAGFITIWFIGLSAEEHYHGDTMGQVVATICCAYLAFFLSEEVGTSGVLALVTAGVVVASYGWPLFISRETLRIFWHSIEFVGNTVIFALAGLIFGGICFERRHIITSQDFFYLGVLYVLSTLIRAIMIGVLWMPLNRLGQQLSPQEAVVMVWSGMRGAVGLLMAVLADRNSYISTEAGTRIMFHMGGMAALMLLINGPLTPWVLNMCGLMDTTAKEAVLEDIRQRVAVRTRCKLKEELRSESSKNLFSQAVEAQVVRMVPTLAQSDEAEATAAKEVAAAADAAGAVTPVAMSTKVNRIQLRKLRESFLRVVKAAYWELCDKGVLPRKTTATKVLLDSADLGMMESGSDFGLSDWKVVREGLQLGEHDSEEHYRKNITTLGQIYHDFEHYLQRGTMAALAFMHAHEQALEEMKSFRREGTGETPEEAMLIREVEEQNSAAAAFVETMPVDIVTLAQTKMLARTLLQYQTDAISELAERGLITDTNAGELEHQLHTSKRNLMSMGLEQATTLMTSPMGLLTTPLRGAAQAGGAAADIAGRPLRRVLEAIRSPRSQGQSSVPSGGSSGPPGGSRQTSRYSP
mmetsp:Transcript_114557/g.244383  ORF Transcript_114557/g.244383 Transcript_114557/m.244383 type:complete len:949 (+) Transcript_114557:177-3023(+)